MLLGLRPHSTGELSAEVRALLGYIISEKVSHIAVDNKARQCNKFQQLHGPRHSVSVANDRKMVVNLKDVQLEDAALLFIKDVLGSVQKAVSSLSEEVAEEIQQESVRLLKTSIMSKGNPSAAESRTLWALRTNSDQRRSLPPTECDGHPRHRLNIGRLPPDYAAEQPRRHPSSYLSP